MKQAFLLTEEFVAKDGRTLFNPVTDCDVFSHYFSALRFVATHHRWANAEGFKSTFIVNRHRNKYGREHMCALYVYHDLSTTRIRITRINTEGWH